MAETKVIHINSAPIGWDRDPHYQYIGRAGHGHDGYFGNPFRLKDERDRNHVLVQFHTWCMDRLRTDPTYRRRVRSLAGKTLVCFCAPKKCHGDVLAGAADYLANKEATK